MASNSLFFEASRWSGVASTELDRLCCVSSKALTILASNSFDNNHRYLETGRMALAGRGVAQEYFECCAYTSHSRVTASTDGCFPFRPGPDRPTGAHWRPRSPSFYPAARMQALVWRYDCPQEEQGVFFRVVQVITRQAHPHDVFSLEQIRRFILHVFFTAHAPLRSTLATSGCPPAQQIRQIIAHSRQGFDYRPTATRVISTPIGEKSA